MKTIMKTFSNRNITPRVAIRVAVKIALNFGAFAELNFAHLDMLVAHPSWLTQRNRFETYSAEETWQRTRKR
jgi:hypothetical protein